MQTRCKFKLTAITEYENPAYKKLEFSAQYDPSIEEDKRFDKYTPNGSFWMMVGNPRVLETFKVGKQYYFDITEAVPESGNK